MSAAIEEFLDRLQGASDMAVAHLAKFRTEPPTESGLDATTYSRLFAKALQDAYAGLDQLRDNDEIYSLLDRVSALINQKIQDSPILPDALQESGAFAAEGSVRAYVLGSVLRTLAPDCLSEFAAAVLKIPAQSALDLEPALETPSFS